MDYTLEKIRGIKSEMLLNLLSFMGACDIGYATAEHLLNKGLTPHQLWQVCDRPDWLLWFYEDFADCHLPSEEEAILKERLLRFWEDFRELEILVDSGNIMKVKNAHYTFISDSVAYWSLEENVLEYMREFENKDLLMSEEEVTAELLRCVREHLENPFE